MRTSPGWSGSLPATGWSSSSPKKRAKATCSARVMSWSRKKSTLCASSRARISSMRAGVREAIPMFTFESSAPMVQVSGSTRMEPCVLTMAGDLPRAFMSDDEDGRAGGGARFEVAVRLRGRAQLVALVDLHVDASGGDVAEERFGQRIALGRVGDVVAKRRACHEERALDRELHRFDGRDRPRCGADADEKAPAPEGIERCGEGILADAVV